MPSLTTRVAALSLALGSLVISSVAATACGSSGRDLRDYPAGQTAPLRKAPAAGTLQEESTSLPANLFSLSTVEWTPGGPMPSLYTCDGTDISPSLAIAAPPEGTAEMALVVKDLDADGFVHWIVAGIPTDTTSIEEGSVPPGSVEALAADGEAGWLGPCPPPGETHTYEFTLHALGPPSGVVEGQSTDAAIEAIQDATFDRSTLTATYKR